MIKIFKLSTYKYFQMILLQIFTLYPNLCSFQQIKGLLMFRLRLGQD